MISNIACACQCREIYRGRDKASLFLLQEWKYDSDHPLDNFNQDGFLSSFFFSGCRKYELLL